MCARDTTTYILRLHVDTLTPEVPAGRGGGPAEVTLVNWVGIACIRTCTHLALAPPPLKSTPPVPKPLPHRSPCLGPSA